MSAAGRGPVVVGVDHSRSCQEAVVLAAWEAERRGLPLRLVHGFLVPTWSLTPLAPLYDEDRLIADAKQRLAAIAEVVRTRRPALQLETVVVRGAGADVLVRESAAATLLVVGSRGYGGFAGLLIGSVSLQVAAHARCPVLVVRGSQANAAAVPGEGPVLVGVDGSADSVSALEFGFAEAARREVALLAVHVWSVPELTGLSAAYSGVQWAADPENAQRQLQEVAERGLAEAIAGCQEKYPDVDVKRFTVHSFATSRTVLEIAREFGAGLLVVGSRGRGGFAGMVLGSVGQALIAHAEAPVAIVRPDH
jgi:nucleotide-binding universal stress UspA family protein